MLLKLDFNSLIEIIYQQSLASWAATVFSLIYIYFAIRNKSICFVFGIIASSIWAMESFGAHLIWDTGLQIFYVVMSIIGLYKWMQYTNDETPELSITKMNSSEHFRSIGTIVLLSAILYWFSTWIRVINFAGLDAITTVTLIIGTILLIYRKLESWIYLVVADVVYVYIYGQSQLELFAFMMVIYSILGTKGYFEWKKIYSGYSG